MLFVVVLAIVLRATAAWLTVDVPGDGPVRATQACQWSQSPTLIRSGVWLPGFTYVVGTVCMMIPNPRVAARLLNLILGSASVPLLYVITRRLYAPATALIAVAMLAVLPLHVGLSASSLSEPAFIFGALAVLWSALLIGDDRPYAWMLGSAALIVCGLYSELTRYEGWVLLPAVVALLAYMGSWRGRPAALLATASALLCFPVLWSLGNYWNHGDALYGFRAGVTDRGHAAPTSLLGAGDVIWRTLRSYLGSAAVVIFLLGGLDAVVRIAQRTATRAQLVHGVLTIATWLMLWAFTLRRGATAWDGRYFILAIVLTLPWAAAFITRRVPDRRMQAVIAVLCLALFASAYFEHHPSHPTVYVTPRRPVSIQQFVAWHDGSGYRDDAMVLTKMNWESTYVPFYASDLVGRSLIVTNPDCDAEVRAFAAARHPGLLVTVPDDASYRRCLERGLGGAIGPQYLIQTIGPLQVFDIRHLTNAVPSTSGGVASSYRPGPE